MNSDTNERMYTLIAKDSTWFAKVNDDERDALLKEHAIEQKENKTNTYQTLYTDKELKAYVKTREKHHCLYCQEKGAVFHWLLPKENGGFETILNLVYTCKDCREIKKKAYLEQQKNYLKEACEIKKRNMEQLQTKKGILCLHCGESKETEAFKFHNPIEGIAYCHECYEINRLNTYFLHNEEKKFEGVKTREEIQQLWAEGRIDYLEQNIVKLFNVPKKQRCVLCKKMKWKSSFKKNMHQEKKKFCRKCEIEKASEGIYTVYDHQHKKINCISTDEASKLEKKRVGKVVSNKSFKIQTPINTYVYRFYFLLKEGTRKEPKYFAISLDGKKSYTLSKEKMDSLLKEGKAEAHNECAIRLLTEKH